MKLSLQKFLTPVFFLFCFSSFSQNQVYWREGFQPDKTPACDLTTSNPATATPAPTTDFKVYFNGNAGTWYGVNVYRTTGTGCPTGNAHIRYSNMGTGTFDSGALVTPIVDYGIQEFHFARARASRSYSIWVTNDTAATTTNWTYVANMKSWANPLCNDTAIVVASPTAKRLKLVVKAGIAVDVDSMWLTSFTPIATPVTFATVNAQVVNAVTKISWVSEVELNTLYYQIERSRNGREFTSVGQLNAIQAKNYQFFDNNADKAYYRIKAVDKDGKITYSSIVLVGGENQGQVTISPNPVKGKQINVQLAGYTKGTYTFNVYATNGQLISTSKQNIEAGSSSVKIQLGNQVKAGIYQIEIASQTSKTVKTISVID